MIVENRRILRDFSDYRGFEWITSAIPTPSTTGEPNIPRTSGKIQKMDDLERLHSRLRSLLHEAAIVQREIYNAEVKAGLARSRRPKIEINYVTNTITSGGITVQMKSNFRVEFFSAIVNAPAGGSQSHVLQSVCGVTNW